MESAVVAAIVAGSVSLVSVLANIYIAYQVRKTAMLQPKIQAMISKTSETDSLLKAYAVEIERLRIRCWNLLGYIHDVRLNPNQSSTYTGLKTAIPAFIDSVNIFENAWALVKGEIPQGIILYIRNVRHDCLDDIVIVVSYMKMALPALDDRPESTAPEEMMQGFNVSEKRLKDALIKLDDLISLVRAIRDDIGGKLGVDTTAESNNSLNRTRISEPFISDRSSGRLS